MTTKHRKRHVIPEAYCTECYPLECTEEISEVLGENDWRKCPYCGSEKHFVNHCPNMRKEESK